MQRVLSVLVLVLACACSRSNVMTTETFNEVSIGSPIALVESKVGKPWRVEESGEGLGTDYIFVQRRYLTPRREQHIHYIFQVDDEGIIFDKKQRLLQDEPMLQWEIK